MFLQINKCPGNYCVKHFSSNLPVQILTVYFISAISGHAAIIYMFSILSCLSLFIYYSKQSIQLSQNVYMYTFCLNPASFSYVNYIGWDFFHILLRQTFPIEFLARFPVTCYNYFQPLYTTFKPSGSVPWVPASMRQVRAAQSLKGYTVGIKSPSGKFQVNFVLGFSSINYEAM